MIRFFLPVGVVLALSGCMQRTVTTKESKVRFGDGWAAQAGDVDKLKEKFASGFEIKNGMAVASGDKKNIEAKKLSFNKLENKKFQVGESGVSTGQIFATSKVQTPEFKTSAATDSRKAFGTHQAEGLKTEFSTGKAAESGQQFAASSKVAREASQSFWGNKRAARETTAKTVSAQGDLILDKASGSLKENPSSLTEDQVRSILHPGR